VNDAEGKFFAADRAAWRAWREEHHATDRAVWLILLKKGVAGVRLTLDEAVEEALCFGWIDGRLRRIDDRRHMLRFSPRRPDSVWADSNKARVEKLIAAGRMTEAGLAVVRVVKERGTWEAGGDRRLDETPPDLEEALAASSAAADRWRAWPPSHRRQYVHWVLDAKRPETRARRIAETVRRAAAGLGPGAAG